MHPQEDTLVVLVVLIQEVNFSNIFYNRQLLNVNQITTGTGGGGERVRLLISEGKEAQEVGPFIFMQLVSEFVVYNF